APSANIFTRRVDARGSDTPWASWRRESRSGMPALLSLRRLHNPAGRFPQRADSEIGTVRTPLAIAMIDKYGLTAGALTGFDITPAVSHDEAGGQVNIPLARRLHQQSR